MVADRIARRLDRVDRASLAAWAIIAAGAIIRLHQFAQRRSLWTDEAALAVNIVQRDFAGLLEPLDGNQGSPVLFLFAQRALVLVGGNNEYALRIAPLLAGLAVLPLVFLVANRLGSKWTALAATALVAFSPSLVRYSTEVKQYSSDAAIAVSLVLLALLAWDTPRSRITIPLLAGVGATAIWASHPALLILAGIGSVMLGRTVWQRRWDEIPILIALGAAWLTSAGALYLVSLRDLEQNEFLTTYWRAGFPPDPIEIGSTARWLVDTVADVTRYPLGLAWPLLSVGLVLVGLVVLGRRQPWGAGLLVAFAPFLLVAAAMERYPIRGRLVLFLVPLLLIAVAGVVEPRRWRLAGAGALVIVAGASLVDVGRVVIEPPEYAAARPAFQHVGSNRVEGDEVWIHDVTIEPYRYYGPIVGVQADRRTRWSETEPCGIDAQGRVWVVFAYTLSTRPPDELQRLREHLVQYAQLLSTIEFPDASAMLFDFDRPPDQGAARTDPELGCVTTAPEAPVEPSGLPTGPFGTGSTS